MAGATGPIGPFPPGADPEEYDRLRRRVLWTFPSGLYLVGSRHGERRNLMVANWVTQVASEPKLVGVGIETAALTHELVTVSGVFTLSTLAREDRALVRKFVRPAEWDGSAATLNGFPILPAASGAPVLRAAVAWVDCAVRQAVACGSHTWFIGEVTGCGFGRDEGTEVLRMEDTRMSYGG